MKLLSREDTKNIDDAVVPSDCSQDELIDQVGRCLAQWVEPYIGISGKVLFLVGPGNNGKDALALKEQLGSKIRTGEAVYWNDLQKASSLNLHEYECIVDGFFGTGLDRPLSDELQVFIDKINRLPAQKVAIDVPSGLDANTGQILGQCFKADHTLTVAAPKRGLFLLPGLECCGEIHSIRVEPLQKQLALYHCNTRALPQYNFKALAPNSSSHKYNRGHVAVALSEEFPGAALMTAYAAQAAGAGYVNVLCPKNLLALCQIQHPTLVFKPYSNDQELVERIENENYHTLVIGAGWRRNFNDLKFQLQEEKIYIFDGGFLEAGLLKQPEIKNHKNLILTPHSGELSRICSTTDRCKWDMVQELVQEFSGVILAKGYDTLVAQRGRKVWLTSWNSPSLAVAGSGDILAGIVAAFSTKMDSCMQATLWAVDAHRRLAFEHSESLTPWRLIQKIEDILNSSDSNSPFEWE